MVTSADIFWKLFVSTGSIVAYILYKQLQADLKTR